MTGKEKEFKKLNDIKQFILGIQTYFFFTYSSVITFVSTLCHSHWKVNHPSKKCPEDCHVLVQDFLDNSHKQHKRVEDLEHSTLDLVLLLRGVMHIPHIFHFTYSSLSYTATVLLDLQNLKNKIFNNRYAVGPAPSVPITSASFFVPSPEITKIDDNASCMPLGFTTIIIVPSFLRCQTKWLSISESQKCVYFNVWVHVNKIQKRKVGREKKVKKTNVFESKVSRERCRVCLLLWTYIVNQNHIVKVN